MDPQHCAVDGWVDAMPACAPRGAVTFYLVVRPADIDTVDDDAPDTVVTCTSEDPRITGWVLAGLGAVRGGRQRDHRPAVAQAHGALVAMW